MVELARGLLQVLGAVVKKSIAAVVVGGALLLRRAMGGEEGALTVLPPSVVTVCHVMFRCRGGRVGEAGGVLFVDLSAVKKGLPDTGPAGDFVRSEAMGSAASGEAFGAATGSSLLLRSDEVERRKGLSLSLVGDSRDGVPGRLESAAGLVGEAGEVRKAEGECAFKADPERRKGEAREAFGELKERPPGLNEGFWLWLWPGAGAGDMVPKGGRQDGETRRTTMFVR